MREVTGSISDIAARMEVSATFGGEEAHQEAAAEEKASDGRVPTPSSRPADMRVKQAADREAFWPQADKLAKWFFAACCQQSGVDDEATELRLRWSSGSY